MLVGKLSSPHQTKSNQSSTGVNRGVGHYEALDAGAYVPGLVEFFKTITTKKQKNTSNSFLERRWRERGKEKRGACGGVELISKEGTQNV